MIEFKGPGIHSHNNHIIVKPSNNFLLKIINDGKGDVHFDINNIQYMVDDHMVSVGAGSKMRTVEHFFSALYGLEIFGIEIEARGNEFPIFDGSSIEYSKNLWSFVHDYVPKLTINQLVIAELDDSYIIYHPSVDQEMIIEMEFSHPFINTQKICLRINRNSYLKEIAPARTFVFTTDNDERLKNLPAYGIGVTSKKFHSREPLRFENELIRHKILDLLGDLYFAGGKLSGHIKARNTFHQLNHEFVKKIKNLSSHYGNTLDIFEHGP